MGTSVFLQNTAGTAQFTDIVVTGSEIVDTFRASGALYFGQSNPPIDEFSGDVQWAVDLTIPAAHDYQAAVGLYSIIRTSVDNAALTLASYYFDAEIDLNHNTDYGSGHDMTCYTHLATGKTLGSLQSRLFHDRIDEPGAITTFSSTDYYFDVNASQIGSAAFVNMQAPVLAAGAAVTNFRYIKAEDIAGMTVSGVKQFINYADKFVVNSAGDVVLGNGVAVKTNTTTAHTAVFQAYDVNGTTYRTFATLLNGDVPRFTVSQPTGGVLAIIPPTSDPGVAGAIWNNAGTLAISV